MFRVPDSSDPPSTPNRRSYQGHPSTTPAGPPPSSRAFEPSFTPKAPVPSSVLGSSQFGTGVKGGFSSRQNTSAFGRNRQLPSSPPHPTAQDDGSEEEDAMEEDRDTVDDSLAQISPGYNPFNSISGSMGGVGIGSHASPKGKRVSNLGQSFGRSARNNQVEAGLDIRGFAKGLAAACGRPTLEDDDDLIVETERIVEQLSARRGNRANITNISTQLVTLWRKHGALSEEVVGGESIGPEGDNANVAKATFLSSLMIQLYCPPQPHGEETPIPKVLLNWLDANHNPSADIIKSVLDLEGGYASSETYWDAIFMSLLRGRFEDVTELLRNANFGDVDTGDGGDGYSDQQLRNIEIVLQQAIDLLAECPAVSSEDWDVSGLGWALFRRRVEQAKEDLRDFCEGSSRKDIEQMQLSRYGRSSHQPGFSLSQSSRRAESKVPFEIYEALQDMYGQMLGRPSDLMKSSYDWLEATIAIATWWDGNEEKATSRRQPGGQSRPVDVTPTLAYRQRLSTAFIIAMEEEDLRDHFNSSQAVHVGLGCIFVDDAEALAGLLEGWSMPIATAFTELASAGSWFADAATARETVENFDQSDLMVLSYGQESGKTSKKDELLSQYAELLNLKPVIRARERNIIIEGWQLALRVLGRLDDAENANTQVAALLDSLTFNTNEQVDQVLSLCNELGFNHHAMGITEKYADALSDSTHRYGDALLYYSRAHKFTKAKKVIDVLIASCLIQSRAYPTQLELDERMRSFISSPKQTFAGLAATDLDAAEHLSTWLSGYATVRKFYELRDADTHSKSNKMSTQRIISRKKDAAEALLIAIASANQPIRGGLFDPSTEVVIPVDGLLVLLGEALPLLNELSPPVLNIPQIFTLLKAVEDLETIGPRIYAQCEAMYQTALDQVHGSDVPSPRALLRKETSGMTASSHFSMVGSSMLNSIESGHLSEGSGVLIPGEIQRGWDWRRGLKKNTKGRDVLRVLRLRLSEAVGEGWASQDSDVV
ncbi:hypothetical protein FKW77_010243 [Venturia effusa]|uniref:Nuclear pore complex protein Nup85 n=1 Tax=Venturia effusa TaxID=50376 RepID=A0A517L6D3_9PEZI|nr:hypothetical protein FKW77_010243 [Venturia effusa]